MDFAINLWNKSKLLFIIAIPLILLFIFKDVIIALLESNIKKTVDNAQKQDDQLAKDEQNLKDQANSAKQQADDIQKQVDNSSSDTVSPDWYKNKKVQNAKRYTKKSISRKAKVVKSKRKISKKGRK